MILALHRRQGIYKNQSLPLPDHRPSAPPLNAPPKCLEDGPFSRRRCISPFSTFSLSTTSRLSPSSIGLAGSWLCLPCSRCVPRSESQTLSAYQLSSSQSVKLDGYEAVESFLSRFSSRCRIYIRSLYVSMRPDQLMQQCDCALSQTDLLVALLSTCTTIRSLTLYVFGSTQKHLIPPFARLIHLTSLFIGNIAPEQLMPL